MTTQQAFKKLLDDYELTDKAGIPRGTIRSWRKRIIDSKVTLDVMEEALRKAGAKKIPEKWVFK